MLSRILVRQSILQAQRRLYAEAVPITTQTTEESNGPCNLKPREIVDQLDSFIIGQADAKRAVAVALRNRWRRHRVEPDLRDEIHPKNMLMVGPTGCGKTEIARRVAKLTDAPFVKVECTKFTEVGFVGRDVDSIIDDLYRAAVNFEKQKIREQNAEKVRQIAKEKVLQALCGSKEQIKDFEDQLEQGELDETGVEVEVPEKQPTGPSQRFGGGAVVGIVDLAQLLRQGPNKSTKKKLPVKDALKLLEEVEMEKLLDSDEVHRKAVQACEQDGIVIIDEIDKVVVSSDMMYRGSQASDEGVQQDLLPLIEGTIVNTKYGGPINTDHILFIASGAFHSVKPSDMIAELQGRLPIRVELQPLTKDDFYRILTEPHTNLIAQNVQMLLTEGVNLDVTDEAIREMADVAYTANSSVQNIGARRLHTVVERVLEDISFNAPDLSGETVTITAEKVRDSVGDILQAQDLRKHLI
jgi:ATP-dependent HslUV protease ATP-binding subunit HslU